MTDFTGHETRCNRLPRSSARGRARLIPSDRKLPCSEPIQNEPRMLARWGVFHKGPGSAAEHNAGRSY